MREVQPEINLLVSPIEGRLVYPARPARRSGSSGRRAHREPADSTTSTTRPRRSTRSATPSEAQAKQAKHNRAKVGSGRPSSLLYTYGPGAIMDLPQFTIMPTGLDDWDQIWRRRDGEPPQIHAPRLREVVRRFLRSPRTQLRPHPWQPKRLSFSNEGNDLGVPARVFPQWLRCTGCDLLGLLSQFGYTNTHPFRTDLAGFEHVKCTGAAAAERARPPSAPQCPARYLLACVAGHLDEFPYDLWVHHGQKCAKAEFPSLRMIDRTAGKGASAMIKCDVVRAAAADERGPGRGGRGQAAQVPGPSPAPGRVRAERLRPDTKLMLVGASNLWFPATYSIIVMPESARGEGQRPRRPDPHRARRASGSPGTPTTWRRSATCSTARSTLRWSCPTTSCARRWRRP